MKFSTFTAILGLFLAVLRTSGSFAQCVPALQLEKITPTTNFYDFNGASPNGNFPVSSITPATGTDGGLGWTGSGTGSVFATSTSTQFNNEVVTQTLSRPVADANLDGNGAVVTISIRPSDGINGVGTTANSQPASFRIIYGGVTYATFLTVVGQTTNATVATAAGATSSHATIPANGVFTTVTITLPASIPNTGTFSVQYQVNSPGGDGGDDYSVRSVSFKSCPTSISGNVFNDIDGPTGGVNGAAIGGSGSATGQLHAILVGPAGTVFASVPVQADGSYSFTDNIYTSDNFSVRLSTTAGTVGAAPPAPGLPPTWFAVSETDNSPNLLQTVTVADANNNNLVGFNFGISQLPPVATDDSDAGNTPGSDAVVNLLANDDLSDGSQATPANTSVALIAPAGSTLNPDGTVSVPGQGVWSYNSTTGDLTFNPDAGFTGDPTPISYTLTETATGLTDNANVTVDYDQAPPVAADDSDAGNTPGSDAVVNLLTNDDLSDGSPATPANTSVALIAPVGGTLNPDGTVTVPGQGVWSYDPATGDLTFNPDAGFTGDPTPISYTLTETATGLTDNANVTVDYDQTSPVAADDLDTGNTPGSDAVVNLLTNDDLSDGSPATPANTSVALIAPAGGTLNPDGTVTVPGQGVWTYNPATGDLTFNPDAGFTGDPTPISYTLTETATGLTDTANVTVDYDQAPPVAADDSDAGNTPGGDAVVNLLANDDLSDGSQATPANTSVALIAPAGSTLNPDGTVSVPGQGVWSYNSTTGDLTFNPDAGFAGDPTPISYTLTETATGLTDNANVTVDYNAPTPPVATDDSDAGNTPGSDAVVNLLTNDDLSDGSQATPANTSITLIAPAGGTLNPDGTVSVPGQGVWSYNSTTGDLTFNPDAGFTGDPTPISYTLTETATGLTDTANVTVDYDQAPPVAADDSDAGNTPGSDAVVNLLANDDLSDGSPATPANTSVALIAPAGGTLNPDGTVTVPGQGVWSYNPATGDLTFNPDAGFTGDPTPISYTLTETATGLTDTANVTVDYDQAPPVAADDSDAGNTPGGDAVVNLLANDDLSDGSPATPANTSVALIAPAGGTLNPDGTVTVPGQGVWTYNPATGDLTFNPDAGFTGDPTPISYTLTETSTGLTDNANVTVDYDQVILADYGDLPYSGATVNYPKVKASFTDADNNHVPDDAGAVWLGTVIDAETDGFTNPANPADVAKGDDLSGVADEDGLTVNGIMAPGTVTWTITANSNQPATVHYGMWVDWGTPTTAPDGTFDDFYSGTITTASPASQTVSVTVPVSFQNGSVVNVRLVASPTAPDQATGFSSDVANGEIEDYQFTYQQALPVHLVSFEAKASEADVELGWKATDQENFDRYEVERSLDGKHFGKIGEVASNNQAAGTYAYSDRAAAGYGSQLYYRLKMVDTDGSFSYSIMRSVRFGDLSAGSIYPNPVTDKLYIRVSDWKLVKSVTIYNLAGLQVYSSGPVASGMVDVRGLDNGIHMLRIRYADGTIRIQKFIRIK